MTAVLNPSLITLPGRGGIAAEILRRLDAAGERPVLAVLRPTCPGRTDPADPADGPGWVDLTGRELADRVRAVAGGLRSDGIGALGVQVLGAYGLTESTTVVSMSSPSAVKPGRVGRALPGCEVLIADDGEILVRGEQVSPGYWPLAGEPEPWLRTGDLGEVDRDGFLVITGRRKEIIVTSGGKNVAPEPLEDRIRLHAGVAHAVVIGEGRPYVSALVFPEPGATLDHAAAEAAVDDANMLVSRAESIRRWRIVDGALSVAGGTLTPSLKLRRAAIAERYAADITALYT